MREDMLLSDLNLTELPLNVLVELKRAINAEILTRKKAHYVARQLQGQSITRPLLNDPSREYEEVIQDFIQFNSERLLALPAAERRHTFRDRIRYLPCLLAQNWKYLFPTVNKAPGDCYVYAHVDPRQRPTALHALSVQLPGSPFYIGKGSGARAWDLKRNQGHGKIIKQIRDEGFPDSSIVQVIAENLSERDALMLEAKLIYLLGSIYDETINGCLLNLADHIKPQFIQGMAKLPARNTFNARKTQAAQAITKEQTLKKDA
jgi:hypothetical protein